MSFVGFLLVLTVLTSKHQHPEKVYWFHC